VPMCNRQHAAIQIAFARKIRRTIRLPEAVETTDCPIGIGQEGGGLRYCTVARTAAAPAEAE